MIKQLKSTQKSIILLMVILVGLYITPSNNKTLQVSAENALPVYRVYNPNSGEHLHTLNYNESVYLSKLGWKAEGISMYAAESGNPLYRVYNPNSGEHFYTLNWNEQLSLSAQGWRYEGVAWYTPVTGTPMYRVFNPNARNAGSHHYTASAGERDSLVRIGWKNENVAWYSVGEPPAPTPTPGPNEHYNSCTEMKRVHPEGAVSTDSWYNPDLDRDHDGKECGSRD